MNATLALMPGIGMIFVAAAAVIAWRRFTALDIRWFWLGAGLWTVAVLLKTGAALAVNRPVLAFLAAGAPRAWFVGGGGLFLGVESSLFEIGLTLLAVLTWHQLGRDAPTAIGIGIGAGAFEALLLGAGSLVGVLVLLAGLPGAERVRQSIQAASAITPLFWLLGPAERIIAILVHAASRALVLLGAATRKPALVLAGFAVFAVLDAVAGAARISGLLGHISMWWVELAILPFAVISALILRWCVRGARWPATTGSGGPPSPEG